MLFSCLSALLILVVAAIIWVSQSNFNIVISNGESSADVESSASSSASSAIVDTSDPDSIVVPNLCDKEYTRVLSDSSNAEYSILQESEAMFSNTVKEGNIISQIPEAGSVVTKGSSIVVVVSKGPQQRELPAINNLTVEEAIKTLSGMGFIVNKTEVANDQIAKGAVIGYKDYKVGDTAPYGSKLTITVSLGAETSA